jgi:hypothetical protein
VSGRDDPESVSGSGQSGTPTATEDVAALDPASDTVVPADTDPTGAGSPAADEGTAPDEGPSPDENSAEETAVPEPVSPPVPTTLPDEVVELARGAAVEEAGSGGLVGDYLGAVQEDPVAVTASFAAADRGYRGWYWSVTVALVEPGYRTISEVVLLPGEQALLAPSWVPWDQRIRQGDVGPGDLLPTAPDDPRLVPGYLDSDDPAVKEVSYEFGFGRVRVLSREGRDDAAERWHDGPFGPTDVVATQAQANCVTCGFFTPLAGLLGMAFGACTNEYSPADGRVVDAGYGCGAHSETVIDAPLISASTATVVDELTLEVHPRRSATGSAAGLEPEAEQQAGTEPEAEQQAGTDDAVQETVGNDDGTGSAEPLPELAMQPDVALDTVLETVRESESGESDSAADHPESGH